MNDYIIAVKGVNCLGKSEAVMDFLKSWATYPISKLRPNKYGFEEPLKSRFDADTAPQAAAEWLKNGRAAMLERTRKPKFLFDIEWRAERGRDPRKFPWGGVIWLNHAAEDADAEILLEFLIEKLNPIFAYATTENDEKNKHFVQYQDRIGLIQKYVGLEIGEQLPGIYWRTYFGAWAEERVGGRKAIERLKCPLMRMRNGVMISPFENSETAGSAEASRQENAIIASLGDKLFFQKAHFNPETLKMNEKTASAIEESIAFKKKFN